jgi:hypothetical protein
MNNASKFGESKGPNPSPPSLGSNEKQRARRKALQSGFSLLARGEPQIWFTGGMLAICLTMIIGLITLILASGLPTFWPRQIDWLVLRDGTLDIGEPQGEERIGAPELSATASASIHHYYRTENYELTNRHYRWLTPEELQPSGIIRIPHATLLERLEWGYLFGIPLRLQEQVQPTPIDQQQLKSLEEAIEVVQLLISEQPSAANEESLGTEKDSANAPLALGLEQLQQHAASKTSRNLRRILESLDSETLQVRLAGESDWTDADSVESDATIAAARRLITQPNEIRERIRATLPTIRSQLEQLHALKRELSRLDEKISQLRIAVRQAELDTDSLLPLSLDAAHHPLEQLEALAQSESKIARLRPLLLEMVDEASLTKSIAEYCENFIHEKVPAQRRMLQQQLTNWRAPLDLSPPAIQAAVARYEQGYADLTAAKEPIQRSIVELREKLTMNQLIVAVPSGSVPIQSVAGEDARSAVNGPLTETLRTALQSHNIELAETPGQLLFDHPRISLIELTDKQRANHLLCVVDTNYLADDSGTGVTLLKEHAVPYDQIVRFVPVNQLGLFGKLATYFDRWREFLLEDPREANTLGGVFPAIWGTIVMTLIMTIAVVPFGVMSALYLREYTRGGTLVSIIRISINNLAGVPSIVYGVFGFSFFCMTIGSFIDGGPAGADIVPWPSSTWYTALALTVIVGTAAFFTSFFSNMTAQRRSSAGRVLGRFAMVLWFATDLQKSFLRWVLRRSITQPNLWQRWTTMGVPHACPVDPTCGNCSNGRGAIGCPELAPRGIACMRRQQMADDSQDRATSRSPRNFDRCHPCDGARRR